MEVPGGPGVVGSVQAGAGIAISADGAVSSTVETVNKIIAGTNVTLDPASGVGTVTISASRPPSNADLLPIGTVMTFFQASAPPRWEVADKGTRLMRVTSGSGGATGGSVSWGSVFTTHTFTGTVSTSPAKIGGSTNTVNQTPSGSVSLSGLSLANTSLNVGQIPGHTHTFSIRPGGGDKRGTGGGVSDQVNNNTGSAGGGGGHSHSLSGSGSFSGQSMSHNHSLSGNLNGTGSFTGGSFDFNVQYVDMLPCSKVSNPNG